MLSSSIYRTKDDRMRTVLKIDYDSKPSVEELKAQINFRLDYVLYYFNINSCEVEIKETNKGYHIRITVPKEIDDKSIVILQAVLGSDWLRELRNLSRILAGDKSWNILFTYKIKKDIEMEEELIEKYIYIRRKHGS